MDADDLIADILECMGDVEPPSIETGWVTVQMLGEQAKSLSQDQIRDKLDNWVDNDNTWWRVKSKGRNWYRKIGG